MTFKEQLVAEIESMTETQIAELLIMVKNMKQNQEILKPRIAGFWQGKVQIAEDFDETSEEIIAAFYGDN